MWLNYAKECGWDLKNDVIVFSADSGHLFDPLFYVFNRPGRGSGDIESVIDMINTLLAMGRPGGRGAEGERFWELEGERLLRATIHALRLAGQPISFVTINRFIHSLPLAPDQHKTAEWQADSYCAEVMALINAKLDDFNKEDQHDLAMVADFVFKKWPNMDERPRSSVGAQVYGMIDKFLYNPLRRLFCSGKCTFIPESVTDEGKLVIIDFPLLEYGTETAKLIQCMMKLIAQQSWLRRKIQDDSRVAFLWQDEMQYFILPKGRDNFFQQSCRGSRIANIAITQNIMNIAEQLGNSEKGPAVTSFIGNFSIKISGQQNDVASNNMMAELIGKEFKLVRNWSLNGPSHSAGHTEQLLFRVEPDVFTHLVKPDTDNPFGEFIVYAGGRTFQATITPERPQGNNWLRTAFSRKTTE